MLTTLIHCFSRDPPDWVYCPFQGYFSDTVMYYGFYTNSTIRHGDGGASYNMQLAYIFTIGAYLVTCFFSLLFRCGMSAFSGSKRFSALGNI